MVSRTDSGFISWLRAHVSPRRGAISVFGALALFLFGAVAVLAVHDEAFQLEGNVEAADTTYLDIDDTNPGNPVNTVTRAGDLCDGIQEAAKPAWQVDSPPYDACTANDWDSLFDNSGPDGTIAEKGSLPAGFVDAGATRDFRYNVGPPITFDTSDGTTFTGGGSKDPNAISDWRCVGANNVTNKGDLTNVYAALYEDASGNEFFYFGAEKNEDSGTNNIGLWLLQDDTVGCPEDQTGNGTAFSGAHEPGDLFIVSEFSNGGGISTIVAYEWVADNDPGTTGDQPGIDPTPVAVGADCLDTGLSSVGDSLCAVTNGVSIGKPWLSVFAGDIDADQLPASFFEGGIELSAFPQFAESCFTAFLFNTRASVSLTAENYDWAMGDIDTCGSKSGTKVEDMDADGNIAEDSANVLDGWTINLYQDDGDTSGALDANDTWLAEDVTDSNGDYSFGSLIPDDYIVCEESQTDWFQSYPHGLVAEATDTCDDLNGNPTNPGDDPQETWGYAFTISATEDATGNDFGNFEQGSKSGTKFEDLNGDGVWDEGESGLEGWTINVYADDGDGVLSSAEYLAGAAGTDDTDANGDYQITGLDPGDYIACEVTQTDWFQSYPNPGTADCTTDSGATDLGAAGYAFTVTSGSSEEDNDFGNFEQGSKSGTKFEDLNGDGVWDEGESGLEGWTINVYADDGDGVLSSAEYLAGAAGTDDTDANGDYQITGLDPGDYIACEVTQTDWFQSYPNPGTADCTTDSGATDLGAAGYAFTVTSGSSEEDNDFGNFEQGSKSGTKFEDLNGDGVWDEGESGLEGWTINVYADDGDGVLSSAEYLAGAAGTDDTDANGDYQITGLDPGDYIACEVTQTDWFQSYPNPGTADCTTDSGATDLGAAGYAFTVTSGSSEEDNDFGNFEQGSKSGTKFEDLNGDGVWDEGESGLEGWTINVYADDGDGVLSSAEYLAGAAGTDDTDANGDYQITGLDPGDYIACEVTQTDWFQSYPNPGTADCTTDSGATDLGAAGYAFTVTSGSSEEDNDFGNFEQGSKSGTKFEDLNGDGVWDEGESGLEGWTINVYADDGDGVLSSAEYLAGAAGTDDTDANGDYQITGLDPGDYIACEVTQTDWFQSYPNPGTADCTTDSGATDLGAAGYAFTVTSGSSEEDNDFGNFEQGSKSGTKFEDLNGDGVWDEGESGLEGWTINVYADDGDGVLSSAEYLAGAAGTDDTDANGDYQITGLDPGDYIACEVTQTDWFQSYPNPGTADCTTDSGATDLGAAGYAFTVTSGSSEEDNDFGNWTPATKSGFKFYDNDEDGSYEPAPSAQNDTILPDWVIELWQWNGSAWVFSASDTTDATGYSFSGLAPGTYAVCEITQTDWVQSFPYSGATLPTGESVFDCTQLTPNGGGTFAAFGIQFIATSGAELTNNLFGNFLVPPGCTLTQGYWKTHSIYGPAAHPDDTWNLITAAMTGAPGADLGPDTLFFDSGQTWIQVFQTTPKGGNAWYILAHQYMAAVLNQLNGAGNVPGLTQALADAYTLLDYYDGQKNIPKNVNNVLTSAKDRNEAITIAGFLGSYNEGQLGVPHCGEEGFTGFTGAGSGLSGLSLLPMGLAPLAARILRRRRA